MPHRKLGCKLHRCRSFCQVEHHGVILIAGDMVFMQKPKSRVLIDDRSFIPFVVCYQLLYQSLPYNVNLLNEKKK